MKTQGLRMRLKKPAPSRTAKGEPPGSADWIFADQKPQDQPALPAAHPPSVQRGIPCVKPEHQGRGPPRPAGDEQVEERPNHMCRADERVSHHTSYY